MSNDIELKILQNGDIQINKSYHKSNKEIQDFLLSILESEGLENIADFFKSEESVELIFGDISFCG